MKVGLGLVTSLPPARPPTSTALRCERSARAHWRIRPGGIFIDHIAPTDEAQEAPPFQIRIRYLLFDARVPPSWLAWVERDIASSAWLAREVARFLIAFFVLAAVFNRFSFTWLTVAALLLGCAAIISGKDLLRRVAYAYQRHGWDWTEAQDLGMGPYVRIAYAVLFAAVFIILTR